MTLNPLYVFVGAIIIALGTIVGVVYCAASGNKDQIPTVIGIGSPLVLMLLSALGISSHNTNVANQVKIADKVGANLDNKS